MKLSTPSSLPSGASAVRLEVLARVPAKPRLSIGDVLRSGVLPPLDRELILSHVTGLDRAGLYCYWERILTQKEQERFWELAKRRAAGEPLAYLTGQKEFMGLSFYVDRRVLIPRPETELLVERALELMGPDGVAVDVGTGSGAVAVSLAHYCPGARVWATDVCSGALEVARANAARHGVAGRVVFLQGDLLDPLKGRLTEGAGVICANLPYIASEDMPSLPVQVRLYEPHLALDGGPGGLGHYERLVRQAPAFLKPGGRLLLEIGYDQARRALALFGAGWELRVEKDLAGLDRMIEARWKGGEALDGGAAVAGE